jgi:hypothetical protein
MQILGLFKWIIKSKSYENKTESNMEQHSKWCVFMKWTGILMEMLQQCFSFM